MSLRDPSVPLPPNIRAAMERKPALRQPGQSAVTAPETTPEAIRLPGSEADNAAEAEIQSDIAKYLRLHDLEYIKPDMRKKSPLPPGWPDFTTAYRGVALALEVKTASGKLDPEQIKRHEIMRPHWRVEVVRGVTDVQTILREIDRQIQP